LYQFQLIIKQDYFKDFLKKLKHYYFRFLK
jgi:hypothetical protein